MGKGRVITRRALSRLGAPLFAFRPLYLLFDQVTLVAIKKVKETAMRTSRCGRRRCGEVRQPKQLKHETIASLAAVFRRKRGSGGPL